MQKLDPLKSQKKYFIPRQPFYCYNTSYPAFSEHTISVNSVGINRESVLAPLLTLDEKATYNDRIDYAAIGKDITSFQPNDSGFCKGSGTSFAAPHVTGFIAALLSKNIDLPSSIDMNTESDQTNGGSAYNQVIVNPRANFESYDAFSGYNNLAETSTTRFDKWRNSAEWKNLGKIKTDLLKELLDKHFVINVDNIGDTSETGKGFLTYLERDEFLEKVEDYVTSSYDNWDGITVDNAFTEDIAGPYKVGGRGPNGGDPFS